MTTGNAHEGSGSGPAYFRAAALDAANERLMRELESRHPIRRIATPMDEIRDALNRGLIFRSAESFGVAIVEVVSALEKHHCNARIDGDGFERRAAREFMKIAKSRPNSAPEEIANSFRDLVEALLCGRSSEIARGERLPDELSDMSVAEHVALHRKWCDDALRRYFYDDIRASIEYAETGIWPSWPGSGRSAGERCHFESEDNPRSGLGYFRRGIWRELGALVGLTDRLGVFSVARPAVDLKRLVELRSVALHVLLKFRIEKARTRSEYLDQDTVRALREAFGPIRLGPMNLNDDLQSVVNQSEDSDDDGVSEAIAKAERLLFEARQVLDEPARHVVQSTEPSQSKLKSNAAPEQQEPVVPKAGTAPTDPWARFAGRSVTKENFLRLVSVDPRDIRSTIARTQKVAWSNYVSNRVVPTHKPNKRGLHGLYPVRDLLAEFQRLAWPVQPSSKIDAVERWTVASDAPRPGYTLNRRN